MELNDYQKQALLTAIYSKEHSITLPTLGLNGEAGEVAEKVKKVLRDNDGAFTRENCQEIAEELGDCLWYIANLSQRIGYSLEEICEMNITKLRSRQQRGKLHGSGDHR